MSGASRAEAGVAGRSRGPVGAGDPLEAIRELAERLVRGGIARLVSPDSGEAIVLAALDAGGPVEESDGRGYRAAIALWLADGPPAAVLVLEAPAAPLDRRELRQGLARLARLAHAPLPRADPHTDARRDAFVALVHTMPLSVVMTDLDMRVLAASERWASHVKQDEAAYLGRSLYEIAPGYYPRFREAFDRCLGGETTRNPRSRFRQPGESVKWLRTDLTPWRDAEGRIAGLISLATDMTDEVEALAASERTQQRLKLAMEIADLHVWEIDYTTGEVTREGVGADSFFDGSLSDADLIADINSTIHPADRAQIAQAWLEAMKADLPFRPEYRINRADGKEVWAVCTTKLLRGGEGAHHRLLGAMQNITERKQVEAALVLAKDDAEAANRAKSVFLATMSHEIRTPLNGVLGMAQAMAADDLTASQRSRLETIRQSGESLLVILNDVLDLSKIEAGKLELEVTDFALTAMVDSAVRAFADQAAGKSLALVLDIDEASRGTYRGDPTRLRQILSNLISNGLKFTEAGEVRLAVARRGGELVFTVTDTGIGIPADRFPRLFAKFEQVDASTTRRFGGTGLGLAICRDLATLMGGDIAVRSQTAAGSRFELTVQLDRVGDEAASTPQFDAAEPGLEGGGALRVLAADDNSVNQLVLRTLLQQVGVEPALVDDGSAALSAWRGQTWDVILMDIQMPVMDGVQATRAIRAEEAATGRARTPILAVTANAMAHQLAEYAAAGMDGVITKPIKAGALFAALQEILDTREDAAAAAA